MSSNSPAPPLPQGFTDALPRNPRYGKGLTVSLATSGVTCATADLAATLVVARYDASTMGWDAVQHERGRGGVVE